MKHTSTLELLHNNPNEKNALKKALGQFYTPEVISLELVNSILTSPYFSKKKELRIIDPFCGDGRLLLTFLEKFFDLYGIANIDWHIFAWDYDRNATKVAKKRIEKFIAQYKLNAWLEIKKWDSFVEFQKYRGQFDVVITNPPWETLKPDQREIRNLPMASQEQYLQQLRDYDSYLTKILPFSQPLKKFAGWGTNLSRCGTEVAINLTKVDGYCGIVIPYSLILDQMSVRLRKWIFEQTTLIGISVFPAETKLFESVDTDVAALVFKKEAQNIHKFLFHRFDRDVNLITNQPASISMEELEIVDYAIPDAQDQSILYFMKKWSDLKSLADLEGNDFDSLWLGRELDETRYSEYTKNKGKFHFLKGKMMGRYQIKLDRDIFVDEAIKKIPPSVNFHRVAWRDISRRSQVRRMQVALVPPLYVTGNSLHVGFFRDNNLVRLRTLLCIMNSIPFEFQVNSRLGTGHVSLGVVRKAKIPSLDLGKSLSSLSLKMMENPSENKEIEIEVMIAKLYNLTIPEYETILNNFNLSNEYKLKLLNHRAWKIR